MFSFKRVICEQIIEYKSKHVERQRKHLLGLIYLSIGSLSIKELSHYYFTKAGVGFGGTPNVWKSGWVYQMYGGQGGGTPKCLEVGMGVYQMYGLSTRMI